jgi:hypothetical protein
MIVRLLAVIAGFGLLISCDKLPSDLEVNSGNWFQVSGSVSTGRLSISYPTAAWGSGAWKVDMASLSGHVLVLVGGSERVTQIGQHEVRRLADVPEGMDPLDCVWGDYMVLSASGTYRFFQFISGRVTISDITQSRIRGTFEVTGSEAEGDGIVSIKGAFDVARE